MARDQIDMTPIETRDELVAWFEAGSKPKAQFAHRHRAREIRVHADGLARSPMTGRSGIRALLEGMQQRLGWEPIVDGGNIIGLCRRRPAAARSRWSPAASSSCPARRSRPCTRPRPNCWPSRAGARGRASRSASAFSALGITPLWTRAQTPVMPKSRYKIMTALHAEGRHARPRHDVPHLHGAGQSRLLHRSRHGQEAARLAGAAAAGDRAVRQLALHRRQAQRLPVDALGDLARHRQPAAPACCPSPSTTAWASSAMSTTRSTCRCISSSAATTYHDVAGASFRDLLAGKLPQLPGERATMSDWANHLSHDVSRGPAEALSRNARRRWRAVAAAERAAGLLGRPALRRDVARRRLGHRQGLERGGAPEAARRRAARWASGRSIRGRNLRDARRRRRCASPRAGWRAASSSTAMAATRRVICGRSRRSSRAASRRPRSCWRSFTGHGAARSSRSSTSTRIKRDG